MHSRRNNKCGRDACRARVARPSQGSFGYSALEKNSLFKATFGKKQDRSFWCRRRRVHKSPPRSATGRRSLNKRTAVQHSEHLAQNRACTCFSNMAIMPASRLNLGRQGVNRKGGDAKHTGGRVGNTRLNIARTTRKHEHIDPAAEQGGQKKQTNRCSSERRRVNTERTLARGGTTALLWRDRGLGTSTRVKCATTYVYTHNTATLDTHTR